MSIGTGFYNKESNVKSMGWDLLTNHIIATAVDTEDVHALLNDFLPPDKYFRFQPVLQDNLAIDEKNKSVLTNLKKIAKAAFEAMEKGADSKRIELLINMLKPAKN